MIRRPLPAAGIAGDAEIADAVLERARYPDVIEPSAAIGQRPIGGAVAPPGVDFFGERNALAGDVDPIALRLSCHKFFAFDRGVGYDFQQLRVRPYVVLMRRPV